MRPSASPLLNPSGLVDQRLQPMWEQLEQVRLLLPQIAHVSYYMESIFNLDRNLTLLTDENVDHHILKDIQIFQGANAYEIAVAEGFVGTVSEWLASLVGPKGDTGFLDNVAHQILTDGIAANAAAIAALQITTDANTAMFGNYVTQAAYDARVSYVDGILAALNTTITDTVIPLLPTPRTDLEITDLAGGIIDNRLVNVVSDIGVLAGRLDSVDLNLINLNSGLDSVSTSFGSFLIDNADTLTRIDVLEATSLSYGASISSIQSVSDTNASNILSLQAASTTANSQILALQTVTADAATQINALQTTNNANAASIVEEAATRASAVDAVATSITTLSASITKAAKQLLVDSFNADAFYWTTAFGGASESVADPVGFSYVDVASIGRVAESSTFPTYLTPKGTVKPYAGMKLRVEAKVRATVNPSSGAITVALGSVNGLTSAWAHGVPTSTATAVDGYAGSEVDLTTADGWVTIAKYITCPSIGVYDAAWRPRLDFTHTGAGGTVQVAYFRVEDVSEVNSLSASVSVVALALADIQGNLTARYGIAVDGGGNGSFISLEDGTSVPSTITLSADKITLDGDVLINGTLTTIKVADNAITDLAYVYTSTSTAMALSGNSEATVQSLAVTTTGATVHINANVITIVGILSGNSCNHWVRLYRDSTIIYQFSVADRVGTMIYPIVMTDNPAAGSYTYHIKIESDITGSALLNTASNRYLSVVELKK